MGKKQQKKKQPKKKVGEDDDEDEEEVKKVSKKKTVKSKTKEKTKKEKASKKKPQKKKKEESEDESESEDEKSPVKTTKVISKAGAVVDSCVPNSSNYHVVLDKDHAFNGSSFSATLNKSDLQHNNNKFYILQLLESDTGAGMVFFTRWGRVGTTGQQSVVPTSFDRGVSLFNSKYREKTRGGYTEIIIDYSDDKEKSSSKKKPKKELTSSQKKKKSKKLLDPYVEEFIKLIYNTNIMNTQMKEIGYDSSKMPLGKLGKQTLNDGYKILKDIEAVLKRKTIDRNSLTDLSSKFYSLIPHDVGFQKMANFIIDTKEKLKAKIEMIESLSDITIATKIIGDEKDNEDENQLLFSYYKKLNCNIRHIDPNEEIYDTLKKYLTAKSPSSSRKLTLVEAFEVERDGEKERYNCKLGNKRLLWHGTRITNYVGILSQGLRIAPPEAPSSGYLFGKGIYLADMAQKSCWYCYPVNKMGLILLVEAALGKIEERKTTDSSLPSTLDKKCNSIQGVGRNTPDTGEYIDKDIYVPNGNGVKNPDAGYLEYNEFIVYNVNQARLRYVLKIHFD